MLISFNNVEYTVDETEYKNYMELFDEETLHETFYGRGIDFLSKAREIFAQTTLDQKFFPCYLYGIEYNITFEFLPKIFLENTEEGKAFSLGDEHAEQNLFW